MLHSTGHTDYIREVHPPTSRLLRRNDSLPWEPTRSQDKAYSWIPVEDSFKKAYMEEWGFISGVLSEGPSSADQCEVIPETPRMSKLASSSRWEPAKPHDKACFLGTK